MNVENPNFSDRVRIEEDRNQTLAMVGAGVAAFAIVSAGAEKVDVEYVAKLVPTVKALLLVFSGAQGFRAYGMQERLHEYFG